MVNDLVLCYYKQAPSIVFLKLVLHFFHHFGLLNKLMILYYINLFFRSLNIKFEFGRAKKLVLVFGMYQIDLSYQNFERVVNL